MLTFRSLLVLPLLVACVDPAQKDEGDDGHTTDIDCDDHAPLETDDPGGDDTGSDTGLDEDTGEEEEGAYEPGPYTPEEAVGTHHTVLFHEVDADGNDVIRAQDLDDATLSMDLRRWDANVHLMRGTHDETVLVYREADGVMEVYAEADLLGEPVELSLKEGGDAAPPPKLSQAEVIRGVLYTKTHDSPVIYAWDIQDGDLLGVLKLDTWDSDRDGDVVVTGMVDSGRSLGISLGETDSRGNPLGKATFLAWDPAWSEAIEWTVEADGIPTLGAHPEDGSLAVVWTDGEADCVSLVAIERRAHTELACAEELGFAPTATVAPHAELNGGGHQSFVLVSGGSILAYDQSNLAVTDSPVDIEEDRILTVSDRGELWAVAEDAAAVEVWSTVTGEKLHDVPVAEAGRRRRRKGSIFTSPELEYE